MAALLENANSEGLTSISGAALAEHLQIRAATVSAHWKDARTAGLLLTQRRFNKSSVQQLAWPGSGLSMPDAVGAVQRSHKWSDAELAWWAALNGTNPKPAPWGNHVPPF